MSWHADSSLLDRYANGRLDAAGSFSVEAHLLGCDTCKARLPRDVARVGKIWTGIRATVNAPKLRWIERVMRLVGISDHAARLLAATPALTASWIGGIAVTLVFALLASHNPSGNPLPFLLVAPVLPLAGVATAYGPGIDPVYEIGAASPMRGLRLLMIRSIAVFATTSILVAAASFALPHLDLEAAGWILPAFALAALCLALSTWLSPLRSAVIVTAGWIAVGIVSTSIVSGPIRVETIVAFRESGQVWLALAAVIAVSILVFRRDRLDRVDR